MVVSLKISLLLLFYVTLLQRVTGQTRYQLSFADWAVNNNTLSLQCKDNTGNLIIGATFYRNSLIITNFTCLSFEVPPHNMSVRVTLTPECDGYFSCGKDGILSEPEELFAYPVKNETVLARTVVGEIGKNVVLTCDFIPSPINRYITKWFKGSGSHRMEISTSPNLQSFVISNSRKGDEDEYKCQILPSSGFVNGPTITLTLKESYKQPSILQGLKYVQGSTNEHDDVFTVTIDGTNLTHEWYINDTLINRTHSINGIRIVAVGNESLKIETNVCDSLRVTYALANVDYSGLKHSVRESLSIYKVCTTGQPTIFPLTEMLSFFETKEGITITAISAVLLAFIILAVGIGIAACCCCYKQKQQMKQKNSLVTTLICLMADSAKNKNIYQLKTLYDVIAQMMNISDEQQKINKQSLMASITEIKYPERIVRDCINGDNIELLPTEDSEGEVNDLLDRIYILLEEHSE